MRTFASAGLQRLVLPEQTWNATCAEHRCREPVRRDIAGDALDHDFSEIEQLAARLLAAMAETLGEGVWEQIGQGIPAWDHCPGLINVEMTVLLRALLLAWGMDGFAKWRYGMLGNESDWLPGMDARNAGNFDFTWALAHNPLAEQVASWLPGAHDLLDVVRTARPVLSGRPSRGVCALPNLVLAIWTSSCALLQPARWVGKVSLELRLHLRQLRLQGVEFGTCLGLFRAGRLLSWNIKPPPTRGTWVIASVRLEAP